MTQDYPLKNSQIFDSYKYYKRGFWTGMLVASAIGISGMSIACQFFEIRKSNLSLLEIRCNSSEELISNTSINNVGSSGVLNSYSNCFQFSYVANKK